jgi:hypothetical protein
MTKLSCVDGCSNAEKAVLLSKDKYNEEWLYRCKILKRVVATDEAISLLGCGSFYQECPSQEIIVLEPAQPGEVSTAKELEQKKELEKVHIQQPAMEQPKEPAGEYKVLSDKMHEKKPEPQKEPVPAAKEPQPATAPAQPEVPVKRKRGRPPKQKPVVPATDTGSQKTVV